MTKRNMTWEIIKKELRDIVRDKKTLIMMIIVPILLYPLLFGFMLILEDSMLDVDESVYGTIGFDFETDETFNTIIDQLGIQKETGTIEELEEKLNNSEINAYISLTDNVFTIYYSGEDTYGTISLEICYELIESYNQIMGSHILVSEGLVPDEIYNMYTIETVDIGDTDPYSEMMLGMIPSFILMTTTLTAVFAAIDMTAGEKERGTLETLLTFPLKSNAIITGKYIATTICTAISAVAGFASMYTVTYCLSGQLETFNEMELLNVSNVIVAGIILILFSMLISAMAIVLASMAKSFKEAQNVTQPLTIIALIPMFISMMGVKLTGLLAVIPFVNVNLMLSDVFSNTVNYQYLGITAISTIVFTAILLEAISKLYKSDKILFN